MKKINIALKLLEAEMKIKVFFIRHIMDKWRKWLVIGVIGLTAAMCISWFMEYRAGFRNYYYLDKNGQRGVASYCWEDAGNLFCDRKYQGIAAVIQYWRGE